MGAITHAGQGGCKNVMACGAQNIGNIAPNPTAAPRAMDQYEIRQILISPARTSSSSPRPDLYIPHWGRQATLHSNLKASKNLHNVLCDLIILTRSAVEILGAL
jgi:hypothetical protein